MPNTLEIGILISDCQQKINNTTDPTIRAELKKQIENLYDTIRIKRKYNHISDAGIVVTDHYFNHTDYIPM